MDDKLLKASYVKEYFKRVIFGADKKIDAWVDSIPAVDAVEVVRCSDCVHFEPFRRHDGFCKIDGMLRENDFFCKYGQRREEDGDGCTDT